MNVLSMSEDRKKGIPVAAFNPIVAGLVILDKYPNATIDESYGGPEFIVSGGEKDDSTQLLEVSDEDKDKLKALGWTNDSVVWMYVAYSLTTIHGVN